MVTRQTQARHDSPFAVLDAPTSASIRLEGAVRYLLVSGRQDDGSWGPVGAIWLSEDERRGGFLVSPWALWAGSELVRGYRSALGRGWSPAQIYGYWRAEVWPRGHVVDDERDAGSLQLLADLIEAL
jgi:hypothetical protein